MPDSKPLGQLGDSFAGLPYKEQMTGGTPPQRPTYAERFGLNRWQTCPVCFGKGLVARGFYSAPGQPTWPSTNTMPEQCRSCGGRGIVR